MDAAVIPGPRGGFTLLELMVVLVIVALLATLAAPAFARLLESTRIRSEAARLMSDVVLSRSESIKRNRQVTLCPMTATGEGGFACGGLLADGWMIFVDGDNNGEQGASEEIIAFGTALAPGLTVTNRRGDRHAAQRMSFYPDGSAGRNRTLMVCSRAQPEIASWSVVMNIVGRPRLARGWGQCPAGG